METFEGIEIEELPLGVPRFRNKVESFLKDNGLALEEVDSYLAVCEPGGGILAGGGIWRDTIKCVAVSRKARSAGLAAPLISRLIAIGTERGYNCIRVFTKPENRKIFESLGFHLLAESPQAILLESSLTPACPAELCRAADPPHSVGPLPFKTDVFSSLSLERENEFCSFLTPASVREPMSSCPACSAGQSRHSRPDRESPRRGIIVMNANPFTLGHRYLAEQALAHCEELIVLVVRAEASRFSFEERFEMVRAGLADLPGVTVCDGGRDVISKEVFPTYFIKNLTEVSQVQMCLDIDLFARQVAPSYGCTMRFVGSEPNDSLTAEYNKMMHEMLSERGIEVVEIPRLLAPYASDLSRNPRPAAVSASSVREIIDGNMSYLPFGGLAALRVLVPETTLPYVLAEMACSCLRDELETPLKPGLVGPDGPGAHNDMDMALMQRSIAAIRPYFIQIVSLAMSDTRHSRPDRESPAAQLVAIGLAAEKAMLEATGGVNTHKGAIFALGIALYATASRGAQVYVTDVVMQNACSEIATGILRNQLNNRELRATLLTASDGVRDARVMALGGYAEVFSDWMPFYRQNHTPVRLLLRIMSTLDDTCVIHRVGRERAQQVKEEAAAVLAEFSNAKESPGTIITESEARTPVKALREMCSRFAAEGISPGGAADMMALTLLMDRLLPGK